MRTLTRSAYSVVMWCLQPFLRRKLARRGLAEPGYVINVEERFGHYSSEIVAASQSMPKSQSFVWIHAVSLGETRVAGVLIAALRLRFPSMKLLLTHGTATGRAEGQKLLQAGDVQVWQAWDTPAAPARFLQQFKPCVGILMETELYPNMAAMCAQFGVPLVMANARLSDKSYRATLRFAWLARPAYQSLTAVWAQSKADAQRFEALGAPVKGVFGNLKFDAPIDASLLAQGRSWRDKFGRPVVMFASSREGEELQFLQFLQKKDLNLAVDSEYSDNLAIKNVAINQIQWLIVPRHPQRFDQVASLIESHGFKVSRRSQWQETPETETKTEIKTETTIWLGDSLGEMALYYGLSDVALLGGSFEPLGGQNLIEAAACACPVLMGPSTFNFAEAAELAVQAGAACHVEAMPQAVDAAIDLARDSQALLAARTAALAFSVAHQGATAKTAEAILAVVKR